MANQNSNRFTIILALLGAVALVVAGYFLFFELRVAAIIVDAIRTVLMTIVAMI
jgi:hypothetical protein